MSRGAQTFRQSDVTKAVRGLENAGLRVARVEIDKSGTIILIPDGSVAAPTETNEWDPVAEEAPS